MKEEQRRVVRTLIFVWCNSSNMKKDWLGALMILFDSAVFYLLTPCACMRAHVFVCMRVGKKICNRTWGCTFGEFHQLYSRHRNFQIYLMTSLTEHHEIFGSQESHLQCKAGEESTKKMTRAERDGRQKWKCRHASNAHPPLLQTFLSFFYLSSPVSHCHLRSSSASFCRQAHLVSEIHTNSSLMAWSFWYQRISTCCVYVKV